MKTILNFLKSNKYIFVFIVTLFITSRIVLGAIGYTTFNYLNVPKRMDPWRQEIYQQHPLLTNWVVWDSGYYIKIAKHGYAVTQPFNPYKQQSLAFFPLYPFSVMPLAKIINDPVVAGLLLSNIYFLIACFFLYKLMRIEMDELDTKRVLLYLFLFPTAYVFSAMFSESLLLMLSVLSIYSARREKWLLAGIFGFLATLTKASGLFLVIPFLIFYFEKKNYSWKHIKPDILLVGCIPLALLCYALYCYYLTGDLFAYSHIQENAWGRPLTSPLTTMYNGLFKSNFDLRISAIGNCIILIAFALGYKKIHKAYWIYGLCLILFPLFTGTVMSSLRYVVVVFPLLMILAAFGRNENVDRAIIIVIALLQGFLFAFWTAGYLFLA